MQITRREQARIRRACAELEILERFDFFRELAGHDYGSGQRARELVRRRRELELVELVTPNAWDLRCAFEKIGRPRLRRIVAENYRRNTPATVRTLRTWEKLGQMYGCAELVSAELEAVV